MDALNFLTHISNYWKVNKDETFFKNVKIFEKWLDCFDENIFPD